MCQPKVAIIIINFNGEEDTINCINSISRIDYKNYINIVVDNCSEDYTRLEKFVESDPNSIFLSLESNLGFSGGNNIGIKMAKNFNVEYVLLLNNDTEVEPDFLSELVKVAETYEDVGIIGGKILYYNQKSLIWYGGGTYNKMIAHNTHSNFHVKNFFDNDVKKVGFITGCMQLIPIEILDKVGPLEESYFLYYEDTDLCVRITNAGFSLYYVPTAVIYHKVSASSGGCTTPQVQYYMIRNGYYFMEKFASNRFIAKIYMYLHLAFNILRKKYSLQVGKKAINDAKHGVKGKVDYPV